MPIKKTILTKRGAASPFRTNAGIPRIYIGVRMGGRDRPGEPTQRACFTLRGTDRVTAVEEAVALWIKTMGLGETMRIVHQAKKTKKPAKTRP